MKEKIMEILHTTDMSEGLEEGTAEEILDLILSEIVIEKDVDAPYTTIEEYRAYNFGYNKCVDRLEEIKKKKYA